MKRCTRFILVLAVTCVPGAFASHNKHPAADPISKAQLKVMHKDPAFVAGYDNGYRVGANDSHALSDAYSDESGPAYEQATDGYALQYGDKELYQQRFRLGYVAGYKAGWDFNAGAYSPLGGGNW